MSDIKKTKGKLTIMRDCTVDKNGVHTMITRNINSVQ